VFAASSMGPFLGCRREVPRSQPPSCAGDLCASLNPRGVSKSGTGSKASSLPSHVEYNFFIEHLRWSARCLGRDRASVPRPMAPHEEPVCVRGDAFDARSDRPASLRAGKIASALNSSHLACSCSAHSAFKFLLELPRHQSRAFHRDDVITKPSAPTLNSLDKARLAFSAYSCQ
jgi:hypothetical protein